MAGEVVNWTFYLASTFVVYWQFCAPKSATAPSAKTLTPDGVLKGLNVIRSFYEEVFKIVPKGSAFEMKQMFIRDNIAYIAWNCESSFVKIPIGADTFIVENGKIKYQTLGAHIIPKWTLNQTNRLERSSSLQATKGEYFITVSHHVH